MEGQSPTGGASAPNNNERPRSSSAPPQRRRRFRFWRRREPDASAATPPTGPMGIEEKLRIFGLSLGSELRARRLEMMDRDTAMFAPSSVRHDGSAPPLIGTTLSAPQIEVEREQTFKEIAGRTRMLISILILWSLLLSALGVVFLIYPLMSGAIDYGVILLPLFDHIRQADALLKISAIVGQWNIPAQILHLISGPGGVILAGFIGLAVSSRELGLTANRERFHRTHNPYNHAGMVFLLTQSGHAVALAGYWTVYRFAPPSCCKFLCLVCRMVPHVMAILLAYGVHIQPYVNEIMLPLSVVFSSVGVGLSLIFVFLIQDIREVLPADTYYSKAFFKPDPVGYHYRKIFHHPSVWLCICALSWLLTFQNIWIVTLPSAHYALKSPIPLSESYLIFLIGDFMGRYFVPFVLDLIVGPNFSRMDLQVLLLIPYIFTNVFLALPIFSPKLTSLFILYLSFPNALLSVYLISTMRATIDNFFLPGVLNIAQTIAIVSALCLDYVFTNLSLTTGLRIHALLSCITAVCFISIWLRSRDFEVDRRGFCSAGMFGVIDRLHVTAAYTPTAMVPLWVFVMREHENIQANYYKWNVMREPPSVIVKKNEAYEDWLKKKKDREREKLREVVERVAL